MLCNTSESITEAYLGHCQTPKMNLFAKGSFIQPVQKFSEKLTRNVSFSEHFA